jgi:hypothetical protein
MSEPYVKQHYPKFLFNAAGGHTVVNGPEQHLELGEGWYESPGEAAAAAPVSPAPPSSRFASDDVEGPALWAAKVEDVKARLETSTDVEVLERVLKLEGQNPKGPRVTLTKFVGERLMALAQQQAAGGRAVSPMTASDLIRRALKTLRILGEGETPTAEEAADAFTTLNEMLDAWRVEHLTVFMLARVTYALTVGVRDYTIGPGGAINRERPVWIEAAAVLDQANPAQPYEIPLEILSEQRWQATPLKNLTSTLPEVVYLDRAFPLATLSVLPVVTQARTLVLYLPVGLSAFADLTTDYSFPPAYAKALRYNLAAELAPEFGKMLDATAGHFAVESLAAIKRQNVTVPELTVDAGLLPRGETFDWRTG